MRPYKVRWNETYLCSRTVEANSPEEAMSKAMDEECEGAAFPDKKEFCGYSDWEVTE